MKAMWTTKLKISAAFLVATVAIAGGVPLAPEAASPVHGAEAKSKPDTAEWTKVEAKVAKLRELVQPKPGEYVTNIAKINWERDPWEAAVRAAKEGKPVIAYGPGMVGVPCGYG